MIHGPEEGIYVFMGEALRSFLCESPGRKGVAIGVAIMINDMGLFGRP